MVAVKHTFISSKADGADSTLVKPSDWNDNHDVVTDSDAVVLGRAAGAGAGQVQELPIASVFLPGFIWPYAGSVVPTGWLLCDGAVVNRADWPALFAVVGTVFNIGGESGTQFRLPDLRGRVIAMIDGGTGRLPGYTGMGAAGGQGANIQPRVHGLLDASGTANLNGTAFGDSSNEVAAASTGSGAKALVHTHSVNVTGAINVSGAIRNDGNNVTDAFSPVQSTMAMNFLIKT